MATLSTSDAHKLGKICGLLDSPVTGEATAAAERVKEFVRARPEVFAEPERPKLETKLTWPRKGTEEYFDTLRHWQPKYDFLSINRGSPLLTKGDLRLIRNVARYRGLPDARTASRVDELCQRLGYQGKD